MLLSAVSFGQSKRLSPELLWQLGRVALDAVSPDGKYAVYGVQKYDLATNKSTRTLYSVEIRSGNTKILSNPERSASDAAFHPAGGRIGFLEDGKLFEVKLDGQGQTQLSDIEMNGFMYAPNGESVLYVRDVKHDQKASELNPDLPLTTGRVMDGLMYRHWKSWHDYQYSNIFYQIFEGNRLSGTEKAVMNEAFDSPLQPMGGMEQITWSPDARWIVYTSRKLKGTAAAQSTNSDIYGFDVNTGETVNFTADLPGYDMDPVFSPDGKYLAWTSMERAGYEADRTRLMVLDLQTKKRVELTKGWDYEANAPQWASDGKSLYFLSSTNFTYQLYQITVADKKIRAITEGQHDYTAFKVAGNELVATRTAMDQPAELYAVNAQTGVARALSKVTEPIWKDIAKGKVERHTVKTTDGKDMNVWMVFPPNFNPAKRYPAILVCQGGPQSALSQGFSYRWNMQLMAANDYVVIAPCRRGMPGSGQAWCDAIQGDWGGKPMQDLLSATDYAAKQPGVDAGKIAAAGASFGGFSVYWLAGNHNKRFKAFIAHCGIFNLESFYTETEEVWFVNHDFEGAFWQTPKPKNYKASPHLFAQNWDTPILVVHNELDFRIPVTEGMQAFQAAQLRGIPSKFLYFPDEGHWMSKPQNSVLWQRNFFGFLTEHLGK